MEYSIRFITYVLQCKGSRDVIKSLDGGFLPATMIVVPQILSLENTILKKNRTKRNS